MAQVVILAGGMGMRIRGVAADLPKSLIPVAGKPFLAWQFELLKLCGISDIVLCLGYRGEQVEEFAGDGSAWNLRVRYSRENSEGLLGTGGAIVHALPLLEPVFGILYGDSYLPFDYKGVYDVFNKRHANALMCVYRNNNQWDSSNIRVKDGNVVYYFKQSRPGEADCIDYGFSMFHRSVFEAYRDRVTPFGLDVIFSDLIGKKQLAALMVKKRFYEIGKPEGLRELAEYLKSE